MDIAIVGYGRMGREVEKVCKERGHNVIKIVGSIDQMPDKDMPEVTAIDFTTPDAFRENYKKLSEKFKAIVAGTTGWDAIKDAVINHFTKIKKSFIYSSNFSLGINIYYEILERLTSVTSSTGTYEPYVLELHHNKKLDAPSGTAKRIESILNKRYDNVQISSVRCGDIKGIHETGFESGFDRITLRHEAYSREGFALGAVLAAEWLENENGIWEFKDILKIKLK